MKNINRNDDGVSPVIATILMVAITVVLAGTLWVMVSDFGEGSESSLTANINVTDGELNEDRTTVEGLRVQIVNMGTPGSADVEDIEIRILYEKDGTMNEYIIDGDQMEVDGDYVSSYTGRDGEDITSGTIIYFRDIDLVDNGEEIDSLDSVELRIDGYSGYVSSSL